MVWLVLTLIGFLVLTAVVIALATWSTRLYEQAQEEHDRAAPPAAQPLGGGRT